MLMPRGWGDTSKFSFAVSSCWPLLPTMDMLGVIDCWELLNSLFLIVFADEIFWVPS